jgi:F-type H+-transporting ATPase subunit gamma
MRTIEELKRKIKSTQDLESVVRTMKTLAAVNIREYDRATKSAANYSRVIELGFQILLRKGTEGVLTGDFRPKESLGAIVYGSDQGMVGQFNEQAASYAVRTMDELGTVKGNRLLLAFGDRIKQSLEGMGQHVVDILSLPGSIRGITTKVMEALMIIDDWLEKGNIKQIILFYNRPVSGSSYDPSMNYILPIDLKWLQSLQVRKWKSNSLPFYSIKRDRLLSLVIHEYIFASLYRAFTQSLASENASRLASMQAAEKNISERMEELNRQYHHQRQSSITSELLDIVSGFEVLINDQ